MKTAAAYIRVSTDDQTEYSPASQKKAVLAYAVQHDMLLPEELIFTDEGISGRSVKRPAFRKMIETAGTKPRKFDVILVWKFSRFARNREDSIVYKSLLRKQYHIDVISVSEPLADDKTSFLIEALLEAMDEYYSINLAEEVIRGMTEKARRGGIMGSQPFGYRSEHGKIVIDQDSAQIVRKIFNDFNAGMPVHQIADTLNTSGIRTRYGNLWNNRNITYLLRNIAYTGKTHWTPESVKNKSAGEISEKTIITDSHEAIISEEAFRQTQEKIAVLKQNHIYKSHPQHGKIFLFKGICRCSSCHATLVRSSNKGVQCHQYTTGKCSVSHFITFEKLTALVIKQLQSDAKYIENLPLSVTLKAQSVPLPDTLGKETQLRKLNQQMTRIRNAYIAGADTLEEYQKNKLRIQKQIDTIQTELQNIPLQIPHENIRADFRSAIQTALLIAQTDASETLKNEIFRSFIREIIFDRKQNSVRILYFL